MNIKFKLNIIIYIIIGKVRIKKAFINLIKFTKYISLIIGICHDKDWTWWYQFTLIISWNELLASWINGIRNEINIYIKEKWMIFNSNFILLKINKWKSN